jgi:hypothetical protein
MNYSPTRLHVAAGAAALAIGARVVEIVVAPAGVEGSTREMVAAQVAHPTASYVSTWATIIAFSAAAFACLTLTGLVRDGRGARLARIGGWLNGLSLIVLGTNTLGLAQTAIAGVGAPATIVKANDAISSSPALAPVIVILALGLVFPIVQGVGLSRAGVVGWWYVALTVVSAVLFFALGGEHSLALNLVGLLPLAAIWATWAWLLNRAADVATAPTRLPETVTA